MRLLLAGAFFLVPSFAAELELRYNALEKIISEQVFTQEGRRYVRGTPKTKCQFAYLEAPHIGVADNGLLRVTARFSGRTALDVFGRCVGLGDSFDLAIIATPVARHGAMGFKDVNITTTKDSYYIRRVRAALTQAFAKDIKIDLQEQAKKIVEQTREGAPYQVQLASFELTDVRVEREALVLVVGFRLVVK